MNDASAVLSKQKVPYAKYNVIYNRHILKRDDFIYKIIFVAAI